MAYSDFNTKVEQMNNGTSVEVAADEESLARQDFPEAEDEKREDDAR